MANGKAKVSGKITQVFGAVVDVVFPKGTLPAIGTALKVTNQAIDDSEGNLTLEIAQHLGDNVVRTIAMNATDGLTRGSQAVSTHQGMPPKSFRHRSVGTIVPSTGAQLRRIASLPPSVSSLGPVPGS